MFGFTGGLPPCALPHRPHFWRAFPITVQRVMLEHPQHLGGGGGERIPLRLCQGLWLSRAALLHLGWPWGVLSPSLRTSSGEQRGPVGHTVPSGPSCVSDMGPDRGFTRWVHLGLLEQRCLALMVQPCPCPGVAAWGKQSLSVPFAWLCCVPACPETHPAPSCCGWGFSAASPPPSPTAAALPAKFVLERDPFFPLSPALEPTSGASIVRPPTRRSRTRPAPAAVLRRRGRPGWRCSPFAGETLPPPTPPLA